MTKFNRRDHCIRIMRERVAKIPPASVRFWRFVNKTETCWLWTGGTFYNGYGAFRANGRIVRAHRFSWELENGPIPSGLDVLHKCDTPGCIRPSDLFLGTTLDNVADRVAKGRSAKTCKLSTIQTHDIIARLANGESFRKLATVFKVCKSTIGNIKHGAELADVGGAR